MDKIGNRFIEEYGTLEDWDNNVDPFRSFAGILKELFRPKDEVKPQANPMQQHVRQLTREQIIEREYEFLCTEFTCELVKEQKYNLEIFISRNLEEHFIVSVNYKDYPERPKVKYPRGIKKLIGKPEEGLLTLANWNEENPPHIVEILRELEAYILKA